jgi:hypothetical protein
MGEILVVFEEKKVFEFGCRFNESLNLALIFFLRQLGDIRCYGGIDKLCWIAGGGEERIPR